MAVEYTVQMIFKIFHESSLNKYRFQGASEKVVSTDVSGSCLVRSADPRVAAARSIHKTAETVLE